MTTSIGCRCRGGNVRSRAVLIARRLIVRIFFKGASGFFESVFFFRYVEILAPGAFPGQRFKVAIATGLTSSHPEQRS